MSERSTVQFLAYCFMVLLPKQLLSRLCGSIADFPLPEFLLQPLIRNFIRAFHIEMSDYQVPVSGYQTFNEFFIRPLKPGARSIDATPNALISPVDGTIGQYGRIEKGQLLQAKGLTYTVADLLDDPTKAKDYEGGEYITIYLAPHNYHRIHSMVKGVITQGVYIPGNLWTVSALGVRYVPNLFAVNERVISYFQTSGGACALVKIGATVVGRIRVKYHTVQSNRAKATRLEIPLNPPYAVKMGEEIAVFELGSTVICLFQPGQVQWNALRLEQPVKLGQSLGTFAYASAATAFQQSSIST